MSVKIRLNRMGSKKKPFYRIIAIDSKKARDAEYLEKLGYFNPIPKGQQAGLSLNREAVFKWLKFGAKPTKVVEDILKREKIWSEFNNNESANKRVNRKKKTRKNRKHPISDLLKRKELKKQKVEFKKKLEEKKTEKSKPVENQDVPSKPVDKSDTTQVKVEDKVAPNNSLENYAPEENKEAVEKEISPVNNNENKSEVEQEEKSEKK